MSRWLSALLFSAVLISFSTRAGASDPPGAPDPDRNLRILLFSHHGAPAPEVLEKQVPGARARLLALAGNERENLVLRERAVIALSGYSGDDVRLLFDRLLLDRTMRPVGRVHLLHAYAVAFPQQARAVLERARTSEEEAPMVRSTAATLTRMLAAPEHTR